MRLTKTDMARVVVTALYNLPELAPADHPRVLRLVRRGSVESLTRQHALAMDTIQSRPSPNSGGQHACRD